MDRDSGQGQDPNYRPEPTEGQGTGLPRQSNLPPTPLPPLGGNPNDLPDPTGGQGTGAGLPPRRNLPPTPLPPLGADPNSLPKQGMSTTMKVVLLIGGLLGICCIAITVAVFAGGALLSRSFTQSPQQAAEVGQSILTYRLPPGYREITSMNLMGNQMVMISRDGSDGLVIMLARLRSEFAGNEEQFRRQFEDQMSRQMGGASGRDFRPVGSRQITIKGTPATLVNSEGTARMGNSSGSFRQGLAAFPLDGDAGFLMIMGPVAAWEGNDLNAFLESIR